MVLKLRRKLVWQLEGQLCTVQNCNPFFPHARSLRWAKALEEGLGPDMFVVSSV